MLVSQRRCLASARGTFDEAFFDEEGFVDILYRTGIFAHSCRDGVESDRASAELIDDGGEEFVIYLIKTEGIDIQGLESVSRYLEIYLTIPFHLREVTYATQKRIRDTGRSSGATGDFTCRFLIDLHS